MNTQNQKSTLKLLLIFMTCFATLVIFGKEISIISFNNFYGMFDEEDKSVGIAKFVSAVRNQVKAANGNAIIETAGDNYQGTALSVLTHGAPVNDSSMGYWITKSMAHNTDSQIAFINSGGIRDVIHKGEITIEDIYNVAPFDNKIVTMKLSGKDLKRVVEHCFGQGDWKGDMCGPFYGLKVKYDSSAKYGDRVLSMSLLDNKPIEMDKLYTVTAIDFIYTGGCRFDFKGAIDVKQTKKTWRNLLIDAVKKQKVLKPDVPNNILLDHKQLKKVA